VAVNNFHAFRDFEEVHNGRAAARSAAHAKAVSYVLLAAISLGASYVSLSLAREALVNSFDARALAQILPDTNLLPPSLANFLETPLDQFAPTLWRAEEPTFVVVLPRSAANSQDVAVDRAWHDSPEATLGEATASASSRIEPAQRRGTGEGITQAFRQGPAPSPASSILHFVQR